MSISSVSPAALGATTPTPSAPGAQVGGLDSNSFLQLLVAQLTHQDPMNPTDATTYITEEAEFSMVQSMNSMSQQNASLLHSQQMQEATSFIGKNVVYTDSSGAMASGLVTAASPGSNGAIVRVGNTQVALSAISEVDAPGSSPMAPVAPTSPTSTDPSSSGSSTTSPTSTTTAPSNTA